MRKIGTALAKGCFWIVRGLVWLFYPKTTVTGLEHLPQEACIVVANHTQMHGPIACELYFPGKRAIWCAGQMMHWKDVPAYAYQDFWSAKPKAVRWFYKILSYLITPISVCVFNHANTLPVYRDNRILTTFKRTVARLEDGAKVVVFPECSEPYNNIVTRFQENFVDIARLYYKRTGKILQFVPMYIAPKLKTMYLGQAVRFDPDAKIETERTRICQQLMERITQMAVSLPLHTVVPYNNVPKKQYPKNLPCEVLSDHEKTSR